MSEFETTPESLHGHMGQKFTHSIILGQSMFNLTNIVVIGGAWYVSNA